jgi:HEAT repeat protein
MHARLQNCTGEIVLDVDQLRQHIRALSSGDEAARREASRQLKLVVTEDWAAAPAESVQAVVDYLRAQVARRGEADGKKVNHLLREQAVAILGALGPRAAPAVPELLALLDEGIAQGLRDAAITALGKIGTPARRAIPKLLPLLETGCNSALACRVARTLAQIGCTDVAVRTALLDLWLAPGPCHDSRLEAGLALCRLHLDAPGLVPTLAKALVTGGINLRRPIVLALAERGKDEPEVVPALVAAQHDEDETVQQLAATGLASLGLTPEQACDCCAQQLPVSAYAEVALLKAGAVAVPALIEAVQEGKTVAREKAARILGSLGEAAEPAAAALTRSLADKHKEVRLAAAKALWNVTKQPGPAVAALTKLLDTTWGESTDENEARRTFLQSVIESLGRIGPPALPALGALNKIAKDDNRLVRESALRAIKEISSPAAPPRPAARWSS